MAPSWAFTKLARRHAGHPHRLGRYARPDGPDWLEYMLNQPHPSTKIRGVMNHLALGVPTPLLLQSVAGSRGQNERTAEDRPRRQMAIEFVRSEPHAGRVDGAQAGTVAVLLVDFGPLSRPRSVCDNLVMPAGSHGERLDRLEQVVGIIAQGHLSLQKLIAELATGTRRGFDRVASTSRRSASESPRPTSVFGTPTNAFGRPTSVSTDW